MMSPLLILRSIFSYRIKKWLVFPITLSIISHFWQIQLLLILINHIRLMYMGLITNLLHKTFRLVIVFLIEDSIQFYLEIYLIQLWLWVRARLLLIILIVVDVLFVVLLDVLLGLLESLRFFIAEVTKGHKNCLCNSVYIRRLKLLCM